jgi:thioredoxin reductase (NADPH)
VPADHLLAFYGLSMELGPSPTGGLGLERQPRRGDAATCETSIPGRLRHRRHRTYPGKLKLILQGFSEAAMAAHAIHPRVFPGEALHFEYSTTKGVPGAAAAG